MAIYAISDLHLSFGESKPMEIFGSNWEGHSNKIKDNWEALVKDDDLVLLPGDFSWAMYLENTYKDFEYLNGLPGKKLLLKGNHDYWWNSLAKMRKFLEENNFESIDFIQNNSYLHEDRIICGARGWADDKKILKRENIRLEISLKDGISKYGEDKEIIVCMHYPPFTSAEELDVNFIHTMKKYNVKKCIYGHIHGVQVDEKNIYGIEFKLVSSDYLDFKLIEI